MKALFRCMTVGIGIGVTGIVQLAQSVKDALDNPPPCPACHKEGTINVYCCTSCAHYCL